MNNNNKYILYIMVTTKLNFKTCLDDLCKKANQALPALRIIVKRYMSQQS